MTATVRGARWFLLLLQMGVLLSSSPTGAGGLKLKRMAKEEAAPTTSDPRKQQQEGPCRVQLTPVRNERGYMAKLLVGGQEQHALIDTGSYRTVLKGQDCQDCAGTRYDRKNSPDYEPKWKGGTSFANFGSGSASMKTGLDKVEVPGCGAAQEAGAAGRAPIHELVQQSIPLFGNDPGLSAIAGLGPGPPDEPEKGLHRTLGVDRFSYCLHRDLAAGGYLVWRDQDPRKDRRFRQVATRGWPTRHWMAKLGNVSVGDIRVPDSEGGFADAIVDTGNELLTLTPEVERLLREAWDRMPGCEQVSSLPTLRFSLGGAEHAIPPEIYVSRWHGDSGALRCKLLVDSQNPLVHGSRFGNPEAILGSPFFRQYYVTFDDSDKEQTALFTAEAEDCSVN